MTVRIVALALAAALPLCGCKRASDAASGETAQSEKEAPAAVQAADLPALRNQFVAGLKEVDYSRGQNFDQTKAPLGLTLAELKERLAPRPPAKKYCRIKAEDGFLTIDAVTRYNPPLPDLFETIDGKIPGILANFGFPGLDTEFVAEAKVECGGAEYRPELEFTVVAAKDSQRILLIEKEIRMADTTSAQAFDKALGALKTSCSGQVSPTHTGIWMFQGMRIETPAASCDSGFMKIVVAGSGSSSVHVAYIDRVGWSEYIAKAKAKYLSAQAENDARLSKGI